MSKHMLCRRLWPFLLPFVTRGDDAGVTMKTIAAADGKGQLPPCAVKQLLVGVVGGGTGGWVEDAHEFRPQYNCTCPYSKAR